MDALKNLGIDAWGIVLYLVNFGLLAFVLTKLLYKPIFKTLDERSRSIKENLDEAERLKVEFQSEMARHAKESENMLKQMQLELTQARAQAEDRAKALIAEAEAKREELIAKAYADVAAMKGRVVAEVERELLQKIEQIAATSMRESVSDKELSKNVERAWDELKMRQGV